MFILRTSGNTMGRDSMEGRVQSSGHSFRPFSSLEGQSHSDYPGRASTGSRMPSTVAPFSSSSDSVKRDNSSRSNSMEKSRLVESRSSSSSNVARESPKKEAVSGMYTLLFNLHLYQYLYDESISYPCLIKL